MGTTYIEILSQSQGMQELILAEPERSRCKSGQSENKDKRTIRKRNTPQFSSLSDTSTTQFSSKFSKYKPCCRVLGACDQGTNKISQGVGT